MTMSVEIPSNNPIQEVQTAGASAGNFDELDAFEAFLAGQPDPDELFKPENHTTPPEQVLPLPLTPEVSELLETSALTPAAISHRRAQLCGEIVKLIDQRTPGLRITREEFEGEADVLISEAFQNALRHGGGTSKVRVGMTPAGGFFIEVANMSMDFPENCLHRRDGQRPLRLGAYRTPAERSAGPGEIDGSGLGLGLINTISRSNMGVYATEAFDVPVVGTDRTDRILRFGVWAVVGGVEIDNGGPKVGGETDDPGGATLPIAA